MLHAQIRCVILQNVLSVNFCSKSSLANLTVFQVSWRIWQQIISSLGHLFEKVEIKLMSFFLHLYPTFGNLNLNCVCPGQDNQEDCVENGVHKLQVPQADPHKTLQALRAGRRQEAKGGWRLHCYWISLLHQLVAYICGQWGEVSLLVSDTILVYSCCTLFFGLPTASSV